MTVQDQAKCKEPIFFHIESSSGQLGMLKDHCECNYMYSHRLCPFFFPVHFTRHK